MSTGVKSVSTYMRELLPHSIRYRFTDSVPNPPQQQDFEDINITVDYNSTEEQLACVIVQAEELGHPLS